MSTTTTPSRGLNIGLWVVQILLGAAFMMAGAFKLFTPIDELGKQMAWVLSSSAGLVRFVGASELAGGLGLLLPSLTRIAPGLTPLAAVALALVMLLAVGTHLMLGEAQMIGVPLLLGALAGFLAWGRGKRLPIAPRT